jgi:periplasmic protein TonB
LEKEKENRNKRTGWLVSIAMQLLMLILFYFLIAWSPPDPPIPTYGIELNFGLEESGSGDEPVTEQQEQQVEEVVEENVVEESEPVVEETPLVEPVETFENTDAPAIVAPKVKDEKKIEEKKVPVEQPKKPVEKVVEKPKETPVKQEALMSKSTSTDTGSKSQGSTTGTGDEGKKEGTIDGRALYGSQGTADGASLQMAGWVWDSKPRPDDKSSETGEIIFKITIDEDGYLLGIETLKSTVSPEVESRYRQSIERLEFSKTSEYKPAASSTGQVKFIIKTK